MKLKVLEKNRWKIVTPITDDGGDSPLEVYLSELAEDRKLKGFANGFLNLFERSAAQGPGSLGTDLYHCVDEKENIYEYIKGPLRLLCYQAKGALLICSHVIRKKRDKITSRDTAPAIKIKNEYLSALEANNVEYIEEGDCDD